MVGSNSHFNLKIQHILHPSVSREKVQTLILLCQAQVEFSSENFGLCIKVCRANHRCSSYQPNAKTRPLNQKGFCANNSSKCVYRIVVLYNF